MAKTIRSCCKYFKDFKVFNTLLKASGESKFKDFQLGSYIDWARALSLIVQAFVVDSFFR